MVQGLDSKKSILIITGMHRSGTSLAASLLQSAGVDVGDNLMGASENNVKGHFEDLDFVDFHENVLLSQGISKDGWTLESKIQVQEQFLEQAKSIISRRASKLIWGWKDPRTTLFLDFWHNLLPEAKFIFIYRSPWEVVDSLYRRGDDEVFFKNPNLAVDIWINYNQAIISFYDNYPDKCLLFNIQQICFNLEYLTETVKDKMSINLGSLAKNIYDKNLLTSKIDFHRFLLIKNYFTQTLVIYQELKSREKDNGTLTLLEDEQLVLSSSYQPWLLQDWLDLRILEKKVGHLQIELQQTQTELQQTQTEKGKLEFLIAGMESSKFWQLRTAWFQLRSFLGLAEDVSLEPKSFLSRLKYLFTVLKVRGIRYIIAKLVEKSSQQLYKQTPPIGKLPGIPLSEDIDYQQWLNKNYPKQIDLIKMAEKVENFSYQPTISIIMPVFNTPEHFLREAIESVLNQVYPYWELCIADDASTEPYIKSVLEEYLTKDSRIKVVFRRENGHISCSSNSAIGIATGEFIALLDHDDLLTPHALSEVAQLLNLHPEADMIYSDEDKVNEQNKLREPFFKPDWCPDSFLSRMYTCHLGVYRRSLVQEIGGFRVGYEGSQDYDFVLRLTEKTDKIFHIPKVLYHWRIHSASTSSSIDSKSYAIEAAKKALTEAIARRGEEGRVILAPGSSDYHIIRYDIRAYDLVSIIIPTKNFGKILDNCLTSIFSKTTYPRYEIILIDNGSTEADTINIINKWRNKESDKFKCYSLDIPFNYSKINNFAVNQAKGKYLLFLNNDTEIVTPDWIDSMVEQAQRKSIGAVGGLLLYPDGTVQHAGVVAGVGGVAGHSHKHFKADETGYFGQIITVNNFSAVTAACLMCRREVFEEVGGFEEQLAVAFNDVDFCFKLVEKGYRNIYLPHVVLYHYESKSRGSDDSVEKLSRFVRETQYMQNKWEIFIKNDPFYNPNLTRKKEDYSITI